MSVDPGEVISPQFDAKTIGRILNADAPTQYNFIQIAPRSTTARLQVLIYAKPRNPARICHPTSLVVPDTLTT